LAKIQEEVNVSLAKTEKLGGRQLLDRGWKGKKSQNPQQQKRKIDHDSGVDTLDFVSGD